jgi:hypothetical protein
MKSIDPFMRVDRWAYGDFAGDYGFKGTPFAAIKDNLLT